MIDISLINFIVISAMLMPGPPFANVFLFIYLSVKSGFSVSIDMLKAKEPNLHTMHFTSSLSSVSTTATIPVIRNTHSLAPVCGRSIKSVRNFACFR